MEIRIWFCFSHVADLGSMDYGRDMQNYILMETWFTWLGIVTIEKIGSLLKLLGSNFYNIIITTLQ